MHRLSLYRPYGASTDSIHFPAKEQAPDFRSMEDLEVDGEGKLCVGFGLGLGLGLV